MPAFAIFTRRTRRTLCLDICFLYPFFINCLKFYWVVFCIGPCSNVWLGGFLLSRCFMRFNAVLIFSFDIWSSSFFDIFDSFFMLSNKACIVSPWRKSSLNSVIFWSLWLGISRRLVGKESASVCDSFKTNNFHRWFLKSFIH